MTVIRIMCMIRGVRFKEIEKILRKDGWRLYSQSGSHCQYTHPDKPGRVTVPIM